MYADSIDFANSKSDSYTASNSSVMDELNAYFKSYIAGHTEGNNMTIDEAADDIFKGAGFDDAMDMINREQPSRSGRSNYASSVNGELKETFDDLMNTNPEQNLLDVEILDQHIDKAGITGGADATRAIENMAGGGRYDVLDPIDKDNVVNNDINDFANAMLGGSAKKPRIDTSGPVKGYSGVTSEIRVKGNRVTERNRNGSNYLTEDGYVDMSMLGGGGNSSDHDEESGDDEHVHNDHETTSGDGYSDHGRTPRGTQIAEGPPQNPKERVELDEDEDSNEIIDITRKPLNDNEEETINEEEETSEQLDDARNTFMASEIDRVLSQLRNKTARTLTGGTVNIRKKVVLTDMYPYIIRT